MQNETQVLVIGGGPAGSTAATLLARQGFQVTLFERDRFPRYHVGESLLPSLLPILDLLGAREKIDTYGFQRKAGAWYSWGGEEWDLDFADLRGDATYGWQVLRSEFDHLLLEHARSQGVDVHEETSVRRIEFAGERAVRASWAGADGTDGDIGFDYLVDASGRAGALAVQSFRSRRLHDVFRNVGVWGYWEDADLSDSAPEGAIRVFSLPEHGWFWAIPLHDGTVSVGLVADKEWFSRQKTERGSVAEMYQEAIDSCPLLAKALVGATLVTGLKVESDYSYVSERFCGPGYLLAGDAACFLDPLLSTGVHLAMLSGTLAAASIGSLLRHEFEESVALDFYQTSYRRSYERLFTLVSAFYDIQKGRETYFREARELAVAEEPGQRLHDSFLNIVSGVEDLSDTKRAASAPRARVHRGHAVTHLTQLPVTRERAVMGIYLSVEPQLGLRRAD